MSNANLSGQLAAIKSAINAADFILIGGGSGLSNASGGGRSNTALFARLFPGYYEKYGLNSVADVSFFTFPTIEEYYAFWARCMTPCATAHL
jgi:NAD-dependent SIR2 family protein deacetylase